MAILPSSMSSDERQISTVSRRRLPRTMTVSPRKRPSSSMVFGLRRPTELSSLGDSSTIKRLGLDQHRPQCDSRSLLAENRRSSRVVGHSLLLVVDWASLPWMGRQPC